MTFTYSPISTVGSGPNGLHSSLGRYRLEGVVSPGPHPVYDARSPSGDRVALKLCATERPDRRLARAFRRAAALRSAARHSCLLSVLDAGADPDGLYLVGELPDVRPLSSLLEERRLRVIEAVRLIAEVGGALDAAASAGVPVGGVGPEDILVDESSGRALLLDVGLVAGLCGPRTYDLLARPHHVSPEAARGEALVGESVVYSLGCVLFHCLTGAPPFDSETPAGVLHRHAYEPPPQAGDERLGLPRELGPVLAAALAKDPADRYRTSTKLGHAAAAALHHPLTNGKGAAPAVVAAPNKARPRRRLSRPALRLPRRAAAGLALAVAVVAGFAVGHGGAQPPGSARLSAVDASVAVPAGWSVGAHARDLPFELQHALTASRADGYLAVGRAARALPPGEPVHLGHLSAYRVTSLRPSGAGRLVLYSVTTSAGTVVAACQGASAGFMDACEGAAATLRLRRGRPLPLTPDRGQIAAVVASTAHSRATGRSRLARARSRTAQATAARSLERSFREGSRRLRASSVDPRLLPSAGRLARAFAATADSYGQLARSARIGKPELFRASARRVRRREAGADAAAAALRRVR